MSPVALLIVVLVCIAISVIVGNKLNINIGILAMAFAYIIGTFIMGTPTKDLLNSRKRDTGSAGYFFVGQLLLFFSFSHLFDRHFNPSFDIDVDFFCSLCYVMILS